MNINRHNTEIQLWQQATKILDQLYDFSLEDSLAQVESLGLNAKLKAKVRELLHAGEQHNTLLTKPENVFIDHLLLMDLSGQTLGDCHLIELLARGGMSTVYRATKTSAEGQQNVAVKVMPSKIMGEQSMQLFAQELTTLSKLSHPNIVNFHCGSIRDTETPYLQMELVEDAHNICDYVQLHDLSHDAIIRLFVVLCEALDYAHANDVIHRDIKPNNVLVDRFGQIKVIDFGIASTMQQQQTPVAYTRTYAAPEQVLKEQATPSTDVYSVCLLLLECLQPDMNIEEWRKLPGSMADKIKQLNISDDLKALFHIGLQDHQEQRFANMSKLKAALVSVEKESHQS